MTNGEQMAKILADILSGCPLLDPCGKIWTSEGWCKDHCKPGQQEPDAECWLKYAEAMVKEAENSTESSLTQKELDVSDTNVGDTVSRSYLLSEYDRQHKGPAGGARKIIEDAPSVVPDINVGDLISRQAAIDALKKISFSHLFECGEYLSEDMREIEIINSNKAFEAIEALPSAPDRCDTCRFVYYPKETNNDK